jgi:CubicO group peptidase (beta-lactamase class C family)
MIKALTKSFFFCALLFPFFLMGQKNKIQSAPAPAKPSTYFPERNQWLHQQPATVGFDTIKLQQAIQFAIDQETTNPRSMEQSHYQTFGREPFGEAVGPLKDRGAPTGLIIYKGYIIAEWGEPSRVDMTHSVTKSLLSTVVGLAVDRGMIRSVQDTVYPYVAPIQLYEPGQRFDKAERFGQSPLLNLFATPHNRSITWDNMLRQTSAWEGTLWGKPDWADRPATNPNEWLTASRAKPGTAYEYNDVRVNALALATLNIWRRPLPQVAREYIMDPIGASASWRWFGYDNSFVVLDGQIMQSVSGGGHWGGGLMINAYDMARFGYLIMNKGKWGDKQLISESWIQMASTPTPVKTDYGFMNYFLNTDKKFMPNAPASAIAHIGNGVNAVVMLPEQDLVIVTRWIKNNEALDGLVKRILESKK